MNIAMMIAASGLKTETKNLERISNDLNNLNTNNYKTSTIEFRDLVQEPESLSHQQYRIPNSYGSAILNIGKDFHTGALQNSGRWNDIAINGDGFLQVNLEDGSTAYTRASSLMIDSDHYLCTSNGYRLADNIQIPEDYESIQIHNNGEVEVKLNDEPNPLKIGNLRLAKFINPSQLSINANGLYFANEQSGAAIEDSPGQSGFGEILQGHVEKSNVDMVSSLMQLSMAQRIYQVNARALQIADQMEKECHELSAR